jgi:hypothetical protein
MWFYVQSPVPLHQIDVEYGGWIRKMRTVTCRILRTVAELASKPDIGKAVIQRNKLKYIRYQPVFFVKDLCLSR